MESLGAIVGKLAAFALFTASLDFLLPEGEMRGYVRFASGLVLLSAMLLPAARFLAEVL